jgi:hypothetical protein
MTPRPDATAPYRLPPGLVAAATRHAHTLREQAIADAFSSGGRWLRRIASRLQRRTGRVQPCLS